MNKFALVLSLSTLPVLPAWSQTAPPANPPSPVAAPATPDASLPTDDNERLRQATLAYNSGLAALKKNDWTTAGAQFARAVQLSPTDAGALSYLGYVRLQQKSWDEALTALQGAQDNGKNLDVHARAQLLNNIGYARWNKNQIPEAKTAFDAALALEPNYVDARYNLAFALISRDDFKGALPHLKILVGQNPNDGAIQDGWGEALQKTGNLPAALGAFKKAVASDGQNENYRFKFALALIAANRPADAGDQLRALLQINPNNAPALLQLGDLHLKAARWNEAAAVLKRYVELKPADFTGHFNLGVAYDYASKWDDAIVQYGEAEKIRASDAPTKNNVGRIDFKRGSLAEAITKFNEALQIDPKYTDARTNLAVVLAAQNQWEQSNAQWKILATDAENATRNASNNQDRQSSKTELVTARMGLASNYLAQSQWRDAADEYNRLILIAPENLDARAGLGRALYNLKDYAKAETTYREIVTRDPKNASAYNDLGVVLEARGNKKDALDSYLKALEIQPEHGEAKGNANRLKNAAKIG